MTILSILFIFCLISGVLEFIRQWVELPKALKIRMPLTLAWALIHFFATIPLVFRKILAERIQQNKSSNSIRAAITRTTLK